MEEGPWTIAALDGICRSTRLQNWFLLGQRQWLSAAKSEPPLRTMEAKKRAWKWPTWHKIGLVVILGTFAWASQSEDDAGLWLTVIILMVYFLVAVSRPVGINCNKWRKQTASVDVINILNIENTEMASILTFIQDDGDIMTIAAGILGHGRAAVTNFHSFCSLPVQKELRQDIKSACSSLWRRCFWGHAISNFGFSAETHKGQTV